MHFVFYAQHEFGCPHIAHCPHLGGASLGYLVHAADEQTEWTGALLRQIDALRVENSAKYENIQQLTGRIEQLERELKAERQKQFKRGCVWHRKWKNSAGPERDREAHWLRGELDRLERMSTDSQRAARLQKRLRRYHRQWLTFLDHPGVSPTNNLAEQALRAVVILRKLTFGSRTRAGAKRLGILMTVIETAKRQGRNVLKFLLALVGMSSNRARRAMYARRS